VTCDERNELIVLYAAGQLEPAEAEERRAHLASGCPQCAGALAQANATLAQLAMSLDPVSVPPTAKQRLMFKVGRPESAPQSRPAREWEKAILPASIAAVLAVAVTLGAVWRLMPPPPAPKSDASQELALTTLQQVLEARNGQVSQLRRQLRARTAEVTDLRDQLNTSRSRLAGVQFAELTGDAQPDAVGRAFIDAHAGKWYFFTTGMKPPAEGKTYELWLICHDNKIPAGTFTVSDKGSAMLLGAVPTLPANASITLAVTDEPMGGVDAPTGKLQLVGKVE
jgi:anti-sigma-K factor RskA